MAKILIKDLVLRFLGSERDDLFIERLEFECPAIVLGQGGDGKTNFIRVLAGVERIKRGEIFFNDVEIGSFKPKKRNFALISKDTPLFERKTVRFNLNYALKKRGVMLDEAKIEHLKSILDTNVQKINAQERIDVLLARVFLRNPDLILIDEPYALTNEIDYFLSEVNKRLDLSRVIIATFDNEIAKNLSKNIVKLKRGRLIN